MSGRVASAAAQAVSKSQILSLYRGLLKRRKTLQHTDHTFFLKRVRAEFERRRNEKNPAKIQLFASVRLICNLGRPFLFALLATNADCASLGCHATFFCSRIFPFQLHGHIHFLPPHQCRGLNGCCRRILEDSDEDRSKKLISLLLTCTL